MSEDLNIAPQSDSPVAPAQPAPTQPAQAGGQAIDISDDTLIRGVPGYNEPVRYGDLYKRLNGDYTRKTQSLSEQRKQFEAERQKYQNETRAERQRLEQLAASLVQRQSAPSGQEDPLFKELASAEYIDGPRMGKFIQTLQEKGFAPIVKAFEERDKITQTLYNDVLSLRKQLNELLSQRQEQDIDSKISRWLTEGGYPQEAKDLAKELYSAYEGDDLDSEFPSIFEQRWNQILQIQRNLDKQRVEQAKRQQIRLPGRGGNGAAARPLGLQGHEGAREIADKLWDHLQTNDQT